jgi:hypothetical protein
MKVNVTVRKSNDTDTQHFVKAKSTVSVFLIWSPTSSDKKQCCGAGRSRRAEIKLPPEAEAEITNSGSSSGSILFVKDLKKF